MSKAAKPDWLAITDIWLNAGEVKAPTFALPDGRIFGTVNKRTDTTPSQMAGRAGITGIMDTGSPDAIRFNWIESNIFRSTGRAPATSGYPGSSLTQADVEFAALTVPLAVLESSEFGEGIYAFEADSQQAVWWFTKRKQMYADAGRPMFNTGSYGSFNMLQGNPWYDSGGNNTSPTNPIFKSRLQSVDGARGSCTYFNGMNNLIGANVKSYMDTPDYAKFYYNKAYAIEVMGKGMGKTGGIGPGKLVYLDWGNLEGLSDGGELHGGIYYNRKLPNGSGTVITGSHPQIDYDWEVGAIFMLGFCMSDGYMAFNTRTRFGVNPNEIFALNPNPTPENAVYAAWVPTNGAAPPVTQAGYPTEPQRWQDAGYEAAYYYSLCNRTAGQPWSYVRYRFDGSDTWIDPDSDGTTILSHAAAFDGPHTTAANARRGRPDVRARVLNGAVDIAIFDPSQPKYKHETLIVQVNGKNFSTEKQGSKLCLLNETL